MPKHFGKEQKDRAVRMLLERLDDYPSMYAACNAIGPKLGIGSETLRRWTLQVQIDTGGRYGPTSDERAEIKTLKSKVRDLEEANEILKQASMPRCEGARPSPPLMCEFIDAMRTQGFGVEQGCQVAPRTYRAWKKALPSTRTIADAHVTHAIRATKDTPEGLYGRRKMTAHLPRKGLHVSIGTVDRLMRDEGLSGVLRGKDHRTTIPGKDGKRASDLLDRDFTARCLIQPQPSLGRRLHVLPDLGWLRLRVIHH